MIALPGIQRNPYKGDPPRPWIRVQFRALNGSVQELELLADTGNGENPPKSWGSEELVQELELLADTGNPFAVIISETLLLQMNRSTTQGILTNFGPMIGGWVEAVIPEIGFDSLVLSYGSGAVVASAQASSPDFGGLIGLPLLRMMRYGGDANFFWVESMSAGAVAE